MSRRPHVWICAAIIVLAALPLPGAAAGSAPWTGEPTLIGGTARYDAGEWVYTDFVYDDYGADTIVRGQPNVVSLAPTNGDFRYPAGADYLNNAADIVEVRVRRATDPNDLEVRVLLQTITAPSVVAIWVRDGAAETVFTHLNATIDAAENTVSFTLPGAGAGASATLAIGAGLHDGNGGLRAGVPGSASVMPNEFTTGGPTNARLFDLAFNTHEIEGRGGAWNENEQSAALASGNLSAFAQTIELSMLDSGASVTPALAPGYYVRLFRSQQDLGEGMAPSFPQYRGRWQPYALWLPDGYNGIEARPLFLNLHSLSVHHNQYRGAALGSSYRTLYEQFDDAIGAIVATPLARGPDGWYRNEALIDTLEVWKDVLEHYRVDPERTFVGGYSMGGYGTYRLATLMPDSFASAVSIVGPPSNGIWAYPLPPTGGEASPDFTHPQLESTRHIPFWITQGVLDELVPVSGVTVQAQRFAELGHAYRYAVHPAEDHLSFVYKDEWSREASWLATHEPRIRDPHRVTLKVRPAAWGTTAGIVTQVAGLAAAVGANLDGGYWVDGVVVAPGADVTASIDLSSGGIARRQTGTSPVAGAGIDGPSPYALTGQDKTWTTAATIDALTGTLVNVIELTIDVGRAGLSDTPDVSGIGVPAGTSTTIRFVRNGVVVRTAVLAGLAG